MSHRARWAIAVVTGAGRRERITADSPGGEQPPQRARPVGGVEFGERLHELRGRVGVGVMSLMGACIA